jgi:hypothetical protein
MVLTTQKVSHSLLIWRNVWRQLVSQKNYNPDLQHSQFSRTHTHALLQSIVSIKLLYTQRGNGMKIPQRERTATQQHVSVSKPLKGQRVDSKLSPQISNINKRWTPNISIFKVKINLHYLTWKWYWRKEHLSVHFFALVIKITGAKRIFSKRYTHKRKQDEHKIKSVAPKSFDIDYFSSIQIFQELLPKRLHFSSEMCKLGMKYFGFLVRLEFSFCLNVTH